MCGIFGIMAHRPETVVDLARLNATACALGHRGPDHHAVFSDARVGLVHTRLSLVDLDARSNQPFWDSQGRYCLVFNGEIYNFRELRAELEADGVAFRTTSDTEVLLESIIHRGVETMLPRLEGMFAFALYDSHQGSLTLARDRFGIKPLYVYDCDNAFAFASEIRALRPWIRFEPDLLSISSYLHGFGGPTSGHSFYRNVAIVPPGTVIVVAPGGRTCYRRFWQVQDFWEPDETARLSALKPRQVVDEVEERMFESVRMQLLADAPVGVLCSGGVDSALITAMAARLHANLAIFHADVAGPHSEKDAAVTVARHLKLDLNAVQVCDQDSIESLAGVVLHYGHPFTYHPNSVPFLMVSKLVRSHRVKAILSGEGADECYVGYPSMIFNLRESVLQVPTNLRGAYRLLRRGVRYALGDRRVDAPEDDTAAIVRGMHNRFEAEVDAEETSSDLRRKSGRTPTDHELATLHQLGYHLRTLLHRNDALGMAASIEARFPFLDARLVRLAANIPYRTKVRVVPTALHKAHYFLRDKWVLREVAGRYLPRSVAQREKRGFPVSAQHRMRIKPEFFNDSFVPEAFGLRPREIDFLVRHASQDLRLKLLHLDVWARVCLDGTPPDEVTARIKKYVALA
ncbi:MAG: asparagine synthase (glutamine-hydrolyzing) [Acidobacteriota bacterium]